MSFVQSLLKRESQAWEIKVLWETLYDEAASLAIPQRNTFGKNLIPGQSKNVTVYDSSLQSSTVKLAGTLQSTITPPFTKWARLIPGPYVLTNKKEQKENLQNITNAVFAAMQVSTFDMAVGEFYFDLLLGTGAMLVLEGGAGEPLLKFITVPISEIALEEGADNTIGAVFRRYEKPARTIEVMWKDFKSPPHFKKILSETPEKSVSISEMTYYQSEKNNWRYVVILNKIGEEEPVVSVDRVYTTNPWIISRWIKVSGEVFGRGPVLNALPDAKTSNKVKELELKNAALIIYGAWMLRHNGILNTRAVKIMPNAMIPVMSTGGRMGADLQKLDVGGNITYSQILQEKLEKNIKDAMFDRTVPDQGGVRSATEWLVRNQELQEMIGAPFGRLHQEFIRPLFKRILDIFYRKGIIPERLSLSGEWEDVKIIGTLAQAQNLKDVEAINDWGAICSALAGPEVFNATAKIENIVSVVGDFLGVPAELIRSEEEKEQILQAAAESGAMEAEGATGE